MKLQEALGLLHLASGDGDAHTLTAEALRRQYLKLALRTHPDKNPGDLDAAERFQRLGAAYRLVLERLHTDACLLAEHQRASALLDLLLRAWQGEAVEEQLQALGEYRPPADFGVDLALSFDARVPPPPPLEPRWGDTSSGERQPDLRQAFKGAFQEDGLTEEGDPVDGYALPPGTEVFF